ncbi:hypothetical protein, partial [Actinomadura soli]|uniref:hypothetical protein n=1 Tax=Actinomadura soli TaxID=2508997 RepID=UPI001486F131
RVVFINDGLQVPEKAPPGTVVVAVGLPDRAGTVWRVRFDGSIVIPADLLVTDPGTDAAAHTDTPTAGRN